MNKIKGFSSWKDLKQRHKIIIFIFGELAFSSSSGSSWCVSLHGSIDLCSLNALPSCEVCDIYAKTQTHTHARKQRLRQTVKIFNRRSDVLQDSEEKKMHRWLQIHCTVQVGAHTHIHACVHTDTQCKYGMTTRLLRELRNQPHSSSLNYWQLAKRSVCTFSSVLFPSYILHHLKPSMLGLLLSTEFSFWLLLHSV